MPKVVDFEVSTKVNKAMDQVRFDIQTNKLSGKGVDIEAIRDVVQAKIDKEELVNILEFKVQLGSV